MVAATGCPLIRTRWNPCLAYGCKNIFVLRQSSGSIKPVIITNAGDIWKWLVNPTPAAKSKRSSRERWAEATVCRHGWDLPGVLVRMSHTVPQILFGYASQMPVSPNCIVLWGEGLMMSLSLSFQRVLGKSSRVSTPFLSSGGWEMIWLHRILAF